MFDRITPDDLIMAFFPCIYFCAPSQMNFYWDSINYRKMNYKEQSDAIIERARNRERFYGLAIKMLTIAKMRGLRLIMENPWNEQTYLKSNFIIPPTMVDTNRMARGDYMVKPTAYWFINGEPTHGFTEQRDKKRRLIMEMRGSKQAGVCSEERSIISPDYARNFICDFILGKPQVNTQLSLF